MVKRFCTHVLTFFLLTLPATIWAGDGEPLAQCSDSISSALAKIVAAGERTPAEVSKLSLTPTFKRALTDYCQCRLDRQKQRQDHDWVAESFRDPRDLLGEDDQCALETFKHDEYQMVFLTQINLKIIPIIQVRLEERYRSNAAHMATMASYTTHLRCLSDKMIYHCAKTYSLATTYQCLHGYFSKAQKIGPLEKDCPNFQTEGSSEQEGELDLSGPRI